MKYIIRLLSIFLVLFGPLNVYAKAPELTPQLAKNKINEFLQAHIVHKSLSPDLIAKTMENFINELDPTRTYFIEQEVQEWAEPDEALTLAIQHGIEKKDFSPFKEMYETMLTAIERRNKIEKKISEMPLPSEVSHKEFIDMPWVANEEELANRILRIRALQTQAAERIDLEAKEMLLKRLERNRLSYESDFIESSKEERDRYVLSYTLKSVASALDNHTAYFTPAEANRFMIHVQQRLYGIGAALMDDLTGLTVASLVEGGPAEQSKLVKVGDKIIAVDGTPIIGMTTNEAVELIRGEENTEVILKILREYEDEDSNEKTTKSLDIKILRKEIVLSESRYRTHLEPFGSGVIATVHLHSFYQDTNTSSAADIRKELEEIQKEHNLLGVILDLRSNAGGILTVAVEVAGLFVDRGVIVSIKDSAGNVQHLRNFESGKIYDGPLLVLTNRASASAAEIVAQSLQDYGRAIVVGDDYSYGKGTYQTFTLEANHSGKVNPEGEFKVTRGMYFTVSGKSPQFTGLKSDIEIPGALSEAEVGERFAKNAIENDYIAPNFQDDLADIHPFHRYRLRAVYSNKLQPQLDYLQPYLPALEANSAKRIEINPNYQAFLEDLKSVDEYPKDNSKKYGRNDLQHEEALNVMKDLVLMMQATPIPTLELQEVACD